MRVTSAVAAASVIANEAKQSRADETLTDQDCVVALGSSSERFQEVVERVGVIPAVRRLGSPLGRRRGGASPDILTRLQLRTSDSASPIHSPPASRG